MYISRIEALIESSELEVFWYTLRYEEKMGAGVFGVSWLFGYSGNFYSGLKRSALVSLVHLVSLFCLEESSYL